MSNSTDRRPETDHRETLRTMSASAMADETTRPRGRAVQAALNNRLTPRDGQILDYWLNGLRKTADRSPTKLEEIRPLMDALRWAMRNSRIG